MLEVLKNTEFEMEVKGDAKSCLYDCGDGTNAIFTGLF